VPYEVFSTITYSTAYSKYCNWLMWRLLKCEVSCKGGSESVGTSLISCFEKRTLTTFLQNQGSRIIVEPNKGEISGEF
jgi:hypothetical protein